MAIATMPGSGGKRNVAVEFAATDAVADVEGLCAWLREEIERHLLSIQELTIDGWNLTARIETGRMKPDFGAGRLAFANLFTFLGRLFFPSAGGDINGDRCDACDKPRSHDTSRKKPGPNSWPGWWRSFRSSAPPAAMTSG